MTRMRSHQLLRVLSTAFGIAVVVGGTIGQGIMRTPGIVAQSVPHAGLMLALWAAGALVTLIDAMSSVELAASIRRSGGPFTFATRAFGPFAGMAIGLTDWLGNTAAIAYISVVFAEYCQRLGISGGIPIGVLAASLPLVTAVIHWFGTRVGGRSQQIGSAVKAIVYAALILALLLVPAGNASRPAPNPVSALGLIVAIRAIVGAYGGWNSAVYFAEEMIDPRRAIARATFSGIVAIAVVYLLMNIAILRALTPAQMAGSNLVAADAAARVFGAPGIADRIVTIVSLVSVATLGNVMIMQFPRVLFAIAREAQVPVLTDVAGNGTPRAALLATAGVAALLATIGVYDLLLAFSLSLVTAMAIAVNIAAIVLRLREPGLERPYRMPLFPLPAIAAMIVNTALLAAFIYEDARTAGSAFLALALMTFVVFASTRSARSRRGV